MNAQNRKKHTMHVSTRIERENAAIELCNIFGFDFELAMEHVADYINPRGTRRAHVPPGRIPRDMAPGVNVHGLSRRDYAAPKAA